ncbi:MAG: hypothetical protein AAGA92_00445 [Planctomycetota bacterium]
MASARPTPFDQAPRDEVDHLLRNAQLRDALEPLYDESIVRVNVSRMTTSSENAFLESMLEWERAPILPICDWFSPRLELPPPQELADHELAVLLHQTIGRLFEEHVVLDFTDHLSDRELYRILFRDILPAQEKRIKRSKSYLHWDCANTDDDPTTWLRYYASEEDRESWARETGEELPPVDQPPYRRRLPRAPM